MTVLLKFYNYGNHSDIVFEKITHAKALNFPLSLYRYSNLDQKMALLYLWVKFQQQKIGALRAQFLTTGIAN